MPPMVMFLPVRDDPSSPGSDLRPGPSGLGNERTPFPLRITSALLPRGWTSVGYHPVGMKPTTRDAAFDTSATATALASEQVTYRRPPSGLRASALGVMP